MKGGGRPVPIDLYEEVGRKNIMGRNVLFETKLAGAERAIKIISDLANADPKLKSGIFGLNNALEILYTNKSYRLLNDARTFHVLTRLESDVTGIVLFAVFKNEPFSVSRKFIHKMERFCEAMQISLLDIIFYSQQGSASLRQQNLL